MRHIIAFLLVAFGTLHQPHAFADSSKTFGDYEVFYSVFNSTFIQPETAHQYGITRGENKAVINIAIRKQMPDDHSAAQAATLNGSTSDLIRSTPLEFKEIKEKNAIYYIAVFKIYDEEVRNFTIDIKPANEKAPFTLKFTQKLYIDPE